MSNYKIFYIDPQSYSNLAQYDYNLLNGMSIDITFFGSSNYNEQIPNNVRFKPIFKYNKLNYKILKILSYTLSLFRISIHTLRRKPDIIHIQWIKCFLIDYIFLKWLKSRSIKIIYTAHNILPHNDKNESFLQRFKKYYNNVTFIIVHTEVSKNELISKFNIQPQKIKVIPHGLLYQKNMENSRFKVISRYFYGKELTNKIVFSCLGSQSFYKGIDFVSKLWSDEEEFRNNPNIHLIIAGQKDNDISFNTLKNIENITIIDKRLSDEEFNGLLKLSDVILLPYRKISQSGVLLTALSENKATLVSNVGGISDPLKIAPIGWNIGDPTFENFKYTMKYIISNPLEVNKIKNDDNAWKKVKSFYKWSKISRDTQNIYIMLIKNN